MAPSTCVPFQTGRLVHFKERPLPASFPRQEIYRSEGEVPVQVGRYEILEIIGSGANGRVARAHDPMIGRLVAIKLFPKELASGEARQRFLQEARVVGQLSHSSLMTLHAMGIGGATQTPHAVLWLLGRQPL